MLTQVYEKQGLPKKINLTEKTLGVGYEGVEKYET